MTDATRTAAPADATRTVGPPAATPADGTVGYPLPAGYDQPEPLGEGGMGVVCRARDLELDREVAIKTLQPRYVGAASAAAQFVREAKITARLQHPGIPPVHDIGTLPDGRPYMVMKLIRGRTLSELLKERGSGPSAWLDEFEAVCHAVGYAHSRGVIHRDLKPANVMVGAFGEVQVMDWGLAKVLNSTEFDSLEDRDPDPPAVTRSGFTPPEPTRTGSTKGTPAYMSPEQARGDTRQIGERSDVFSLGAVLLTLLTGRPPYTGADVVTVVRQAATGDLADAHRRLARCGADRDVISLCRKCLSADPADRPADAEQVATEVARIRKAAEQAVHTRRVRRWQLALGGVAVVVSAALGFGVWLTAQAERQKALAVANTRGELARTLDEVERRLAKGDWDEAAERFLDAKELAGRDPDPDTAEKGRLGELQRNVRTSRDLMDFYRYYADKKAPAWGAFEKAFTRVGITLDLARADETARQVSRHPFAGVFHAVLKRQADFDPDPDRRRRLSAVVNDQQLVTAGLRPRLLAMEVESGAQAAKSFAPSMFGD